MKNDKPLTPQQIRFCHEYMAGATGGMAASRAGYSWKGAASKASRLLRMPKIMALIEQLQAEQLEKSKITAQRVINELALVAFSDIGEYLTLGNQVREIAAMPEQKRRAIKSITITQRSGKHSTLVSVNLKLHDKNDALRILGRQFGITQNPVQITANRTQNISINTGATQVTEPAMLRSAKENVLPVETITGKEQEEMKARRFEKGDEGGK